ncbi:unnamed protein product (macronuclear) [Paramecium tetraurelia]|uniref:cAMP-dependent protein kinase regulatory subunit n=1 Tax=Paramecium tetraurelia TaxID=5888 RepID=Q3SED3_PARTE|nr:uncharacterized protein GSPATT00020769001 [Paramecium tetraurelia]CAI38991.1 cAMP-dependent protein kinase, regulatory subunit 3-2 [Paramecium tetraurelia]CAK87116.1 unnamed protein product [Paramecium tetraurelia]|eukprot:XP_001454513.1 hypothetical protein (macronuclear) [Paramecium tetraurelia strain d4-2]
MSEKKVSIQDYIKNKVKPVFDQLIARIVIEKPEDVYSWSIGWLQKQQSGVQVQQHAHHDLSEEDEDEEEVVLEIKQQQKQQTRTAVSAEVYGDYNKKEDFKPRFIQKSEAQIERIKKRILNSFMFQALDEKDLNIVLGAMDEKKFQVGDVVIKQGDDGNELYVIDEGRLECYKKFTGLEEEKLLKTYIPGESFGELALLYNAPRAATIKAIEEVTTFALDRETFNNIVKFSAIKKREQMEEILSKIELLQSMDNYERVQLCDVLKEEKHKAGETIITEGEIGDRIYLIIEGELEAYWKGSSEKVYDYKPGDYFGELALLKNTPRQATVTAKTDVVLLYCDFNSFRRLMGPLEEVLKRNVERYEKYLQQ